MNRIEREQSLTGENLEEILNTHKSSINALRAYYQYAAISAVIPDSLQKVKSTERRMPFCAFCRPYLIMMEDRISLPEDSKLLADKSGWLNKPTIHYSHAVPRGRVFMDVMGFGFSISELGLVRHIDFLEIDGGKSEAYFLQLNDSKRTEWLKYYYDITSTKGHKRLYRESYVVFYSRRLDNSFAVQSTVGFK